MDDETDSWAHRDEIFAKTRERLKAKTTAEWLDILLPAGVWAGPVHGYAELVEDPQVRHNGSFIEYERTEEHTSELQSLMRISYAVFCLKKKNKNNTN